MSSGSSSAPTAKLEPTKSNEADPAKASKPVEKVPALLEEDDEFEDFPVEGMENYPMLSTTERLTDVSRLVARRCHCAWGDDTFMGRELG